MKRTLLLLFSFMAAWGFAQEKATVPAAVKNYMVTDACNKGIKETQNPSQTVIPYQASRFDLATEEQVGMTVYDLQSNTGSPSGRTYLYPDGFMATVWTRGMTPASYSERGTGYNYFDGTQWGPEPTVRIETQRTGWPGYAPCGNGEIVAAHHNTAGLVVTKRANRGTGTWTQSILAGPAAAVDISWPRIVSSGANHDTIHILASTYSAYEGQNLALLYYRSNDQGATWDIQHYIDPAMNSTAYYGFSGDSYVFAEPFGNNLAFLIADSQNDLFIMKSADAGETWTKTVVWEHPYPMLNVATTATDTLYAPDGAAHMSFDKQGKLHIVFGVYRVLFNGDNTYSYWPGLSGIAYWNEDQPTFTGGDQMNILDPDLLDANGSLIGYYNIDWDGNGSLDILDDYGNYGLAFGSMPQIAFDDNNNAILVYSSIIEGFDNGVQQYRHIFARASSDNAQTWGQIVDLTNDPIHIFDECVFPVIAQTGDGENWYFAYQYDNEPGLAIRGDEDTPTDNFISMFSVSTLLNEVKELNKPSVVTVSNTYPNPSHGETRVDLNLERNFNVSYFITSITGQQLVSCNLGQKGAGRHTLQINNESLSSGIYFLNVKVGEKTYTNKLIVE
jgi:hypothetical protein